MPRKLAPVVRKKAAPHTVADEPIIFGRVIAEREYRVGRRTILLQIGTPHRASWKTAFYCPLRFVSGRQVKSLRAFGLDAVQALMLAFDRAKITMEETWPEITYAGSEKPGDTGIYRRISGLGVDFDKEVAGLIEKAARARLRKLKSQSISAGKRAFGSMRGVAKTTAAFFEPLPDAELEAWEKEHRRLCRCFLSP